MPRFLQLAIIVLSAIVWIPVIGIIAVLVRLFVGAPVLFRQQRPGLRGQAFELVKFRTMRIAHDAEGRPLPDAARMTPFGSWLRATSLDELPELLNVLRGEMSLVGPRPLLPQYLPLYSALHSRRHEVRPGITGWAQINGRNALDWHGRLDLDVWYVDHRSFSLDVRILVETIRKVLMREGVSAAGEATVGAFAGYAPSLPVTTSASPAAGSGFDSRSDTTGE